VACLENLGLVSALSVPEGEKKSKPAGEILSLFSAASQLSERCHQDLRKKNVQARISTRQDEAAILPFWTLYQPLG